MTYESRPAARECKWLLLFKIILKFSNSLCFPCVFPKFLSGITFHNFPCFPCAVGTLVTMTTSNQGHTMILHTYTPNQCPYQVSTSYTLRFLRYSPDKIFKLKVTKARSKVKSRSHHDVAHLHSLTNVPTKYQLPTPYGFRDTGRTNFFPPPTYPPIRTPWVKTIPRQPCGVKNIFLLLERNDLKSNVSIRHLQ